MYYIIKTDKDGIIQFSLVHHEVIMHETIEVQSLKKGDVVYFSFKNKPFKGAIVEKSGNFLV